MWIHLSNDSKEPLYEQIKQQMKQQIIDGTLKGNRELPSIRALAKEIKTSVITVKRAYSDLELEGFIYTRAGKGTFVKDTNQEDLEKKLEVEFKREMKKLIELGYSFGLTKKKMIQLFSEQGDE